MQLIKGFCVRRILDETIAVPIKEEAQRLSGFLSMNGTGELLFQLLQTSQTHETLVEALLENYEIDRQTAEADVTALVEKLREDGLLEEV